MLATSATKNKAPLRGMIAFSFALLLGSTAFGGEPTYRKIELGLTGDEYTHVTTGQRSSTSLPPNGAAQVAGRSVRFASSTSSSTVGGDAFLYANGTTTRIGLIGEGYEYPRPSFNAVHRSSNVFELSDAGQVAGFSFRYATDGTQLGKDAWRYFDGVSVRVNPNGGVYEWVSSAGAFRNASVKGLRADGSVVGSSARYASDGSWLGDDAWVSSGAATILGLVGSGYEVPTAFGNKRISGVYAVGSSGAIVGTSKRFLADGSEFGDDIWLHDNNGQTHLINLTGPGYETTGTTILRSATIHDVSDAGTVAGSSVRLTSSGVATGRDAWVHSGGLTRFAGLTGAGYEYTKTNRLNRLAEAYAANAAGDAVGYTTRYSATGANLGRDVWVHGNSTRLVGLVGPAYEQTNQSGVHRYAFANLIDDAGRVAGYTERAGPDGNSFSDFGRDAWFDNGQQSVAIGLTGSPYEMLKEGQTVRSSTPIVLDERRVLGVSKRYINNSEYGQAGWIFDSTTGATTPLIFPSYGSNNLAFTEPTILTDEGVVLGMYKVFDGAVDTAHRAFWWSEAYGYNDLGDLVEGGLPPVLSNYFLGNVLWANDALDHSGSPHAITISGLKPPTGSLTSAFLLKLVIPGDTNNDDLVNFDDLVALAQNYGVMSGQIRATGDLNRDGATNFDDLVILAQNYGAGSSIGDLGDRTFAADWALAQSFVPEPTCAFPLLIAVLLAARRRSTTVGWPFLEGSKAPA